MLARVPDRARGLPALPVLFALLALLAPGRSTWAAAPEEIRFAVDVTEVEDADGLVHALGWPVVAGDRLDGSIRIDSAGDDRIRARLRLTCGRLDLEHTALRFSLDGEQGATLRVRWLGGTTLRVHGGRAIRILVSLRPTTAGGHALSIELNSLEEAEGELHDAIRGNVRSLTAIEVLPGPPWVPIAIGASVALVAALAGFAMLRRRTESGSLPTRPRILR